MGNEQNPAPNDQQESQNIDKGESEKWLDKSEGKYQDLFESIDQGFCIIEMIFNEKGEPVDYRFEEVNPAFEEHTGMEDVEGKTMREIIPEHEDHWFEVYGKVAVTGEPIRFEQSASALGRVLELYAYPFGHPDNNKVAVLFRDVTQRRQAQGDREGLLHEVQAERKQLADIFQQAPSFMCVLRGPNHVFTRANELYYKLVGDRDLIGKTVEEALPEIKNQGFIELLDEVYQTGESFSATDRRIVFKPEKAQAEHREHEYREPEYRERYLDFIYQPLYDSNEEIVGVFVQGIDMTERKQAQEKLQEINETLEQRVKERTKSLVAYQEQLRLLASKLSRAEELERQRLATELHDNLGQMLAVCKMKIDQVPKGELSKDTATLMKDINKWVEDALDYARTLMSDLKPPPALDKEDITATIEWVAETMKKHNLEVIVEDDGRPKKATENIRTVLLQCVRELLMNVIKHSEVNKAKINIRRLDDEVQIVVQDEGQGFDPEMDIYSIEKKGYGLFNVRERIDLLGGSTEVIAEPGKGTQVKLIAPLKEELESVPQQETEEEKVVFSSVKNNQLIKVMLVDDHEMVRKGLKKIVENEDDLTVVAEASDGVEAVELAQEKIPDIIVMDVDMPRMNGISATEKIVSRLPNVRVVALSLHDHQEVINNMRNAGATAYLSKNEAFETLCATIRSEAKSKKT